MHYRSQTNTATQGRYSIVDIAIFLIIIRSLVHFVFLFVRKDLYRTSEFNSVFPMWPRGPSLFLVALQQVTQEMGRSAGTQRDPSSGCLLHHLRGRELKSICPSVTSFIPIDALRFDVAFPNTLVDFWEVNRGRNGFKSQGVFQHFILDSIGRRSTHLRGNFKPWVFVSAVSTAEVNQSSLWCNHRYCLLLRWFHLRRVCAISV